MTKKLLTGVLLLGCISGVWGESVAPSSSAPRPLVVGPVALNGTAYASAATVTANALGSGTNGPETAQTGLTVNISKDNWWTGGKVGEVDGINVLMRQNGPDSDGSGLLINVQNQGKGFLSATEFASSIVDPVSNTLTHGIDVQEGVLNQKTGDYIGAVYSADYGALSTGVLIQNSTGASWKYAIQYLKDGKAKFSVDGLGNLVAAGAYFGGVGLNGDPGNGSIDLGNLANSSATPYLDLNGYGKAANVRLINDGYGQLTISTASGATLQLNQSGLHASGSLFVNLAKPASSSAPCTAGQLMADQSFIYVCVAENTWRRSPLGAF